MIIKNRIEVVQQLAELLRKFDIELNQYDTDVYLYYNSESQTATLDTFVNVSGREWLDDDHYTIYILTDSTLTKLLILLILLKK